MNEVPTESSGASKQKKPFPWTWIILALVLSAPVLFVGYIFSLPFQVMHEADAGFRKARKTIDPEELRLWANEMMQMYPCTNEHSVHIPISQLPTNILTLYSIQPEMAWTSPKTDEDESSVVIIWGGGFFHWGFYIGPTNFSMPVGFESDHEFAHWVPGIYYAHEGKRRIK